MISTPVLCKFKHARTCSAMQNLAQNTSAKFYSCHEMPKQNINNFFLFFPDGRLKKNARLTSWVDLDSGDIQSFFGCFLLMGVVKKPTIESYWEKDEVFATPFFRKIMSRNHFQAILSNLHYCDDTEERQKEDEDRDRLKKLRGFIDKINDSFKCYTPGRNLSLDEGGCPYKGRLSFKVYNPLKPNKWAIKTYQLCESVTGYTLRFEVYDGGTHEFDKSLGLPEKSSVTELVVMRLLHGANCLDKGYHLYMDNYYNSPTLFEFLEKRRVMAAGTLNLMRKNTPKLCQVKPIKQKVPDEIRGNVLWSRRGNQCCLVWYDKRRVATLSTIHKAVFVQTKNYKNEDMVKPAIVADYCKFMFGVDLSDQKAYYYTPLRRSYKWWRKLFFHLFNICVLNAHILHKIYAKVKLNLYEFRRELALALIHRGQLTARLPRATGGIPSAARLSERHFPAFNHFSAIQQSRLHLNKKRKKHPSRQCIVCKHETVYQCPDCEVSMCPVDCFKAYHTERDCIPDNGVPSLRRAASDNSEASFNSEVTNSSQDSEESFLVDRVHEEDAEEDWMNMYQNNQLDPDSEVDFPNLCRPAQQFPDFPQFQDPNLDVTDKDIQAILQNQEDAGNEEVVIPAILENEVDQVTEDMDVTLTQDLVTAAEINQSAVSGDRFAAITSHQMDDFVNSARRTIADLDTSVISAVDDNIPELQVDFIPQTPDNDEGEGEDNDEDEDEIIPPTP